MVYTQMEQKVYRDSKNIEYKEGDIVYNPCIGDYWIVRESIPSDNTLCPYQLLLWDSREEYFMDLDEPAGFEIVSRRGDTDYKILLGYIHKVRRHHKWEAFKDNISIIHILTHIVLILLFMSLFIILMVFLPVFLFMIVISLIVILICISRG